MNLRIEDSSMKVIPTSFSQEGASMLTHCKNLLEHEESIIAINPKYEELIISLRGAKAQEYKLNKTETPFMVVYSCKKCGDINYLTSETLVI
jgi:hypothetical protein